MAAWTATHVNGWTTGATENPDGTFAAWTTNEAGPIRPDYIEDTPEHAMLAADYALKQKTGHRQRSLGCSDCQLHTGTRQLS